VSVPDRLDGVDERAAPQPVVVAAGQRLGLPRVARQQVDEAPDPLRIEPVARWELPQERPRLAAERQDAAREEVRERALRARPSFRL
jgi:hypothetical protein